MKVLVPTLLLMGSSDLSRGTKGVLCLLPRLLLLAVSLAVLLGRTVPGKL